MNLRKTKLIVFSIVVLTGMNIPAAEAKNKNVSIKTGVKAKKTKSVDSTQTEYPLFTCPGLKENGYCSNRPELEPKQNLYNLPRTHLSDHQDVEQFINGNSDTLYGFDAVSPSKKKLPSAEP